MYLIPCVEDAAQNLSSYKAQIWSEREQNSALVIKEICILLFFLPRRELWLQCHRERST